MFGTKCPSITSRWIQSAPAASTARTSSPSLEKSDARIDGAMTRGRGEMEADIGAVFRKPVRYTGGAVPPNTRGRSGQCGRRRGGKICRKRHQLPVQRRVPEFRTLSYHWLFPDGTA